MIIKEDICIPNWLTSRRKEFIKFILKRKNGKRDCKKYLLNLAKEYQTTMYDLNWAELYIHVVLLNSSPLEIFLRQEGVLTKFKYNLKLNPYLTWNEYNTYYNSEITAIVGAFRWNSSIEGFNFWNLMNDKWIKFLKS